MKEEGGKRKEEGGRRKEEGGRMRNGQGKQHPRATGTLSVIDQNVKTILPQTAKNTKLYPPKLPERQKSTDNYGPGIISLSYLRSAQS